MSGKDNVSGSPSKPKVHRLPALVTRKKKKPTDIFKRSPMFLFAGLVMLLFAASFSIKKPESEALTVKPSDDAKTIMADNDPVAPITMADARVGSVLPEKISKTIVIKGQAGIIIGQMAKIPAESEQITEIKAVSDIDNDAGRELLSIISKY